MKKLLILLILLLLCGAWFTTITSNASRPVEYQDCLKRAADFEEKEIYYDAILYYRKALEYNPDDTVVYQKMAEDYRKLGDLDSFETVCRQRIAFGGNNDEIIIMLADYYLEKGDREDAIALLREQIRMKDNSAGIQAKLNSLAGEFDFLNGSYDEISLTVADTMRVCQEGEYGLLNADGTMLIVPNYSSISLFSSEGLSSVCKDGSWYLMDKNEYRRRVPEDQFENLGVINNGLLPASENGKYGYLSIDLEKACDFIYDAATPFIREVAAVQRDGKWALIDTDLNLITEYIYDGIVTDDWGFCSRNGVVFVKKQDTYQLVDAGGNILMKGLLEVHPFVSGNPAAVRMEDGWHFITPDGSITMDCSYDEAKSFSSLGYAPVRRNNSWGYIKENGDLLTPLQFDDAGAFNSDGVAPVKLGNTWYLIQLDIF